MQECFARPSLIAIATDRIYFTNTFYIPVSDFPSPPLEELWSPGSARPTFRAADSYSNYLRGSLSGTYSSKYSPFPDLWTA